MSGPATFAIPPTFLGIDRRDRTAPICIAGIPLDIGTTNRSGARFGPGAVRQASRMLEQRDVYDWTLGAGVTVLSAQAVHETGTAAIAQRIRDVVEDGLVYLSVDIDVLDPAFAPGTGTPEIGGLASWQFQANLRRLGGLRFAGMDLVEVAPAYDVAELTSLAGATIIWEYLALLASREEEA